MATHDTYETWRDLLKLILSTSSERQRIAREISVSPVTLGRWISGATDPRIHNLRLLLQVVPPQYQEKLQKLLMREFGDIFGQEDISTPAIMVREIPSIFYEQALQALTQYSYLMRSQFIFELILRQAILQIDPARLGLAVNIVRCSPPRPGFPVRSLRDGGGMGTPPWKSDLGQRHVFLGEESLCGRVVSEARPLVAYSSNDANLHPVNWFEFEKSAAAAPIMRGGVEGIAGCLLVASTQIDYFNEARLSLLERYANLVSLAFKSREFIPLSQIVLQTMPSYERQLPILEQFSGLVKDLMAQSQPSISLMEAHQLAWQQIEDELIALP